MKAALIFRIAIVSLMLTATGTEAVWLLNLKGQPPYRPVILYNKPEEISSDPLTRQDFPGLQRSLVNSLFVINP
jgi:hypothetical protein